MQDDRVEPADERRHRPGVGPGWEESWYLDFASADGTLAGYVRLGLHPAEGQAWFWVAVVGGGPPLVAVRDHEVPLPSGPPLEVRAPGLWSELVCETPLDHWSVGLEAFGVALDDPLEAWGSERGDPYALGLDVEWEALAPPRPWPAGDQAGGAGYAQACTAHGDVLVGDRRLPLDGSGTRLHLWGPGAWSTPWAWAAGRLDDGTSFLATANDVAAGTEADGLLRSATVRDAATGLELAASTLAHAPVLLPGIGRLARAFCRYEAADGRVGHGWAERLA